VDVVISNCVINLSPDKKSVFAEIHRVLKPGGRIVISDVLRCGEIPEAIQNNPAAYTG
jgi:ubiquinone/menaquinone biosynthesis C-methylase UbiE